MISSKDWNVYTDMLDIENEILCEKMLLRNKELAQEHARQNEVLRAQFPDNFLWTGFPPTYFYISSRKRTIEGCLDWVKEGRPIFAKTIQI